MSPKIAWLAAAGKHLMKAASLCAITSRVMRDAVSLLVIAAVELIVRVLPRPFARVQRTVDHTLGRLGWADWSASVSRDRSIDA